MSKSELLKELEKLKMDIDAYAKYLCESTYHPYDKVESFGNRLGHLIRDAKDEDYLYG